MGFSTPKNIQNIASRICFLGMWPEELEQMPGLGCPLRIHPTLYCFYSSNSLCKNLFFGKDVVNSFIQRYKLQMSFMDFLLLVFSWRNSFSQGNAALIV